MIGVAFMPTVFTHFFKYLLNIKMDRRILAGNYIFSLFIAAMVYSPLYAYDFEKYLVVPCWGKAGILFPVHLGHFFLNIIYSHYKMFRVLVSAKGILRRQIAYVFTGTMIGYGAGVINYFLWFRIPFPPVFNIFISLWVISIAYAIARYRLMDIKIFAVRTLMCIFVYVPLLMVPVWSGYYFRTFLERYLGSNWWLMPITLMGLFSVSGLYIYNKLKLRAEKLLKHKKLMYLQQMSDFLEDVKNVRTLDELIKMVIDEAIDIIEVKYAGVYLLDKDAERYSLKGSRSSSEERKAVCSTVNRSDALIKYLVKTGKPLIKEELKFMTGEKYAGFYEKLRNRMGSMNASCIIPSFCHDTLIAAIVLGERSSLETYKEEDEEAFMTLSVNVGLAIKNALFVEDLHRTQAELHQANTRRRMHQMADGMSHQFNNRFISIAFPAGLAKDIASRVDTSCLSHEDKERIEQLSQTLQRIEENAVRGGEIARGLLRLTRKEKQKFEMLDVVRGFDLAVEMVEYKHPDFSKITINRHIEGEPVYTFANLAYLQEMYYIILDNAYDAIKNKAHEKRGYQGVVDLFISYEREKGNISVIIGDNGEGMSAEVLDKVRAFVPYTTTKASSATSGYGAGVHMLKRFVELHEGEITYESEEGKGTRVRIELPVISDPEEDPDVI
jgi:signal transduction histidine kinase